MQVSPLRFASVEMTNFWLVVRVRVRVRVRVQQQLQQQVQQQQQVNCNCERNGKRGSPFEDGKPGVRGAGAEFSG